MSLGRALLLVTLSLGCVEDATDDCDQPCPSGEVCSSGRCFPAPCTDATPCESGFVCTDGICAPVMTECGTDDDCPDGRCVDGECFDICFEGEETPCQTACGPGVLRCIDGRPRPCAPLQPCDAEVPPDAGPDAAAPDADAGDMSVDAGAACELAVAKPSGDVELGPGWFPRVIWSATEFAVFWSERADPAEPMIRLARLFADGRVLASAGIPDLLLGDIVRVGNAYAAVGINAGRLTLLRLSSSGDVTEDAAHPDLTRSGLDSVLAFDGETLALVWSDNLQDLHFARFDADLRLLSTVQLTHSPGRSMDASIANDALGYTVAFYDERRDPDDPTGGHIYLLQLGRDGSKRAPEAAVAQGRNPSLVRRPGGYAVAYEARHEARDAIYLALLDDNARVVGEPRVVGVSTGNARAPSLATTDDGFGLVWTDARAETPGLYFLRLDENGAEATLPLRLVEVIAASGPDLQFADGVFALAWFANDQVFTATGPFGCGP